MVGSRRIYDSTCDIKRKKKKKYVWFNFIAHLMAKCPFWWLIEKSSRNHDDILFNIFHFSWKKVPKQYHWNLSRCNSKTKPQNFHGYILKKFCSYFMINKIRNMMRWWEGSILVIFGSEVGSFPDLISFKFLKIFYHVFFNDSVLIRFNFIYLLTTDQ